MSTLTEIEAAVKNLSRGEQEALLLFITGQISHAQTAATGKADPFDAIIGAFSGPCDATGRKAEEILYGKDA